MNEKIYEEYLLQTSTSEWILVKIKIKDNKIIFISLNDEKLINLPNLIIISDKNEK